MLLQEYNENIKGKNRRNLMMNEHSIGFAAGFILAGIAVIAIKRIMYGKSDRKPEYDEMQKAAQGMAYKYGFFTAIITGVVCAILDILDIHLFADGATPMFLILFLSAGAFAGYSIWKEAYFGLHANTGRYIRFLFVVTVINLISAVQSFRNGTMLTNGKLNYTCVNLWCAILLAVMLVIMLIKKNQKQEEE